MSLLLADCACSWPPDAAARARPRPRLRRLPSRRPSAASPASARACKGPAGLKATLYATGLRNVSALRVRRGRVGSGPTTSAAVRSQPRRRLRDPARGREAGQGDQRRRRARSGSLWHAGQPLRHARSGGVDVFSDLVGHALRDAQAAVHRPARAATAGTTRIVALPERPARDGHLVGLRPLRQPLALVGDDRLLPPGRERRAGLRVRHPAPFGLAYDRATGALLTSMNQRDDLGAKTPGDWLALVREGQNWRFPGCYGQGGSACRGVPKPLAVLDQHAAAGGVAIVSGTARRRRRPRAPLVSEWERGGVLRVPLRALRLGLRERAGDAAPERLHESAAAGASRRRRRCSSATGRAGRSTASRRVTSARRRRR